MVFNTEPLTISNEKAQSINSLFERIFEVTGAIININSLNDDEYTASQFETVIEELQVIHNVGLHLLPICERCEQIIESGEPYTEFQKGKFHHFKRC